MLTFTGDFITRLFSPEVNCNLWGNSYSADSYQSMPMGGFAVHVKITLGL